MSQILPYETGSTVPNVLTTDTVGAKEAIERTGSDLGRMHNSGDAVGMAALYTEDAALFPPGTGRVDGKPQVEAFWKAHMDSGLGDVELTTVELVEAGEVATEVGIVKATVPSDDGGRVPVTGKFMVLWRKGADGTWRLHRDIWNLDQ